MGRILGLDVGERRIGVAISDPDHRLAVPLRVLECQDRKADTQTIIKLAEAEGAEALVVGHPVTLAGGKSPQTRLVEEFAERLAKATTLPVELWDERLTSVQAGRGPARPKSRRAKSKRRPRVSNDDLAAALILQGYLDRRRANAPTP